MRAVQRVTVVGSGVMGAGIAQVASEAGHDVTLVDISDAALEAAHGRIRNSLAALTRADRVTAREAAAVQARITLSSDLEPSARRADMTIEAIVEELGPKQRLFAQLDDCCRPDVVLASNTSQFPIGRVAELTAAPERVIGMHWSNPPQMMPLVEVVLAEATSTDSLEVVRRFLNRCDRSMVVCRKDIPGFISNRLILVLFMEAARLVDEGVAEPWEIDEVAELMFGHKMGPLATMDLAGLDTVLRGCSAMADYYGDRYRPAPTLRALVEKGQLGRKTGAGFHEYDDEYEEV